MESATVYSDTFLSCFSSLLEGDSIKHWIDYILMEKLAETRKKGITDGGNSMVRLLNGLSSLCACDGAPQKKVQRKSSHAVEL